ncbi:MAG TPA: hypothetical protein DEQ47_02575 [Solibacterales bacterium]|nr:hypothetical protein [Bryobacterales bacterium]
MRHLPRLLMLVTIVSCPAAEQMKVGDLYKMCTSSNQIDKTACSFYVLGVFEGAGLGAGAVRDKSGTFRELKDKPFCVPEGLSSAAMELVVKMKMGEDLAVYPQDREMPAVSFVIGVIVHEFPCQKAN